MLFCSQSVPCVAKTLQFICARRNLSTPISHPNPNIFFAFLNKVQKYSVSYLFYRMQSSWINRNGKKFPSYLKLFTLFKYSYNKSFMLFWKPHFSDTEIFVKSNSFMCDGSPHHSLPKWVNWKCFHFKPNTNLELKCTNWPKWNFILYSL